MTRQPVAAQTALARLSYTPEKLIAGSYQLSA
jgi:hypothetical protein